MRHIKKLPFISLILIPFFLSGCNESGKKTTADTAEVIAQEVQLAQDLVQQGKTQEGLQILENLDEQHPDNQSIIEALAYTYSQIPDNALAAFYFEQLYRINPTKTNATLNAAQNYIEINDWEAAARNYENYLQRYPNNAMAWRNLGLAKTQLHETKAALKAYLTAIQLNDNKPLSGIEALQVAQLFISFGNVARAEEFYKEALQDASSQENALLGLIAIELQSKNTYAANQYLQKLDKLNPEAFDQSPLASARTTIALTQTEQTQAGTTEEHIPSVLLGFEDSEIKTLSKTPNFEAMESITFEELPQKAQSTTTTVASEKVNKSQQQAASVSLGAPQIKQAQVATPAKPKTLNASTQPTSTPLIGFDKTASSTPEKVTPTQEATPSTTESKVLTSANITKNMKTKTIGFTPKTNQEATQTNKVQTPSVQIGTIDASQAKPSEKRANITNTKEKPTLTSAQQTQAPRKEENTSLMVEFKRTHNDEQSYFAFKTASTPDTSAPKEQAQLQLSPIEQALKQGIQLQNDGKWQDALQAFWKAVELDNNMPEPWNRISQTYFEAGLMREAQQAAQEALKRNPNSLKYTLNFLRTSQKSMPADAFIEELLRAKTQFPDAPEITLGLARTYEKVLNQPQTAAQYYYEFIHQSPEHPNKTEAKAALQRLL